MNRRPSRSERVQLAQVLAHPEQRRVLVRTLAEWIQAEQVDQTRIDGLRSVSSPGLPAGHRGANEEPRR